MNRACSRLLHGFIASLLFMLAVQIFAQESAPPIRIGVLAYRGVEQARQEWQAHADYLGQHLPGQHFLIVPLGYAALDQAVADRSIDLLITNTGHYTELETTGAVSRVATRLVEGPNGPLNQFGGTALTLSQRQDIQGYRDLKGKHILIPDRSSLGGWQVHLREGLAQGIDLEHDTAQITELGNHEKVVQELMAGHGDAGFVRSDLIEAMSAAGKLPADALRVIDARQTSGYPFQHSTRLYPEWPLARVGNFPEELTKQILIALLAMHPEDPAARQAHIHGWTLPQNYQSVLDLFREARLGPYAHQEVTWQDILHKYGTGLLLACIGLAGILAWGLLKIARDNHRLRESEQAQRLAAGVFLHAEEGILITDVRGTIVDANESAARLTGYTRQELIGKTPRLLRSGAHDAGFYAKLWETLLETGNWRGELHNRRKNGTIYIQHTSISSIRDRDGKTRHYIGLLTDITERKANQAQLEHMAYYDALTGLPNRQLLADRLKQAIAYAERHQQHFAICYLDLDNFKPINDRWGHAAGDELLIEVAARLSSAIRQNDTVCRLGGDEFVILLNELATPAECEQALARISETLYRPITLSDASIQISASTGVTLYPDDGTDPDTLLRHADHAMYLVKHSGRSRYQRYRRAIETDAASEQELDRAFANHELVLHYQPKVDMHQGIVVGAEALLRWQHPVRGLLPPGDFLPLIEQGQSHAKLGEYVIRQALTQMDQWQSAGLFLAISVNIDARHLQQADFVPRLNNLLADFPRVSAKQLEFEIVETAALQDLAQISERIADCCKLGVQFAIDDFGTGYSSLSYLKQLPMQTLKIDCSFVRSMLEDPDDLAIVDGVIGLAGAFRRRVIAEGVETIAHGTLLLKLGCEWGQGYGIAHPMPPEALHPWVKQWKQPPEWRYASRWPTDDLPLLTVEVDHVRWVKQCEERLLADQSGNTPLPTLDPHACRFGQWLDSDGRERYGELPAFQELIKLHDEAHHCCHELIDLHAQAPAAARARIGELYRCRSRLLEGLHALHQRVMQLPA